MVGIIGAVVMFLAIILIHEFGHMAVAKRFGVGVVEYSVGMGPVLWTRRWKDTAYSIRLIPFGGYCAMYGEQSGEAEGKGEEDEKPKRGRQPDYKTDWKPEQSLQAQSPMHRFLIYIAGPAMNLLLGLVCCLVLTLGFNMATVPTVAGVIEDSIAAETDIQEGDVIVKVNDRSVMTWNDYTEYQTTHANLFEDGYTITVLRDGEEILIDAALGEDGLFGITVMSVPAERTVGNILKYTGNTFRYMVLSVTDSFYMLAHGTADASDLSGVVGVTATISDYVNEAAKDEAGSAIGTLIFLGALISVNLGLLNMFPFPALDGGRSVMCVIEAVFRRKIPEKVELAINTAGMACLMLLMFYTLINDVGRIMSGLF